MKSKKIILAAFYISLTIATVFALVLLAYRMIGAAGAMGAVIIVFAIVANGFISKIDDDEFYKK